MDLIKLIESEVEIRNILEKEKFYSEILEEIKRICCSNEKGDIL